MKKIILVSALIAFSDAALAHTGLLPTDGFIHGFQHPFLGLDHFLVILGLGLWASSQARLLALQAIGVFLSFMIVGALFGLAGFGFAYVETGILISLVMVGIALSFGTTPIVPTLRRILWGINGNLTLVPKLQLGNPGNEALASRDRKLELPALNSQAGAWELADEITLNVRKAIILMSVAVFASMHGLAHGSEIPVNASAYVYIAGFVSATAVLHVSGLVLGWIAQHINAAGLIHIYGSLTGLIGTWLLLA
ncbi:MAG: HupE/UreJ family protein [Methylobacter sp.]